MGYEDDLRARLAADEEALRRAKRAKDANAIGLAEGRIAHARAAARAAGVELEDEAAEPSSADASGRRARTKARTEDK